MTSAEIVVGESDRLLQARQFEEALPVLLEATRLAPDNPMVSHNLGAAYLATRRLSEAILWLRRSMEQLPTFARTHFHLGLALQYSGDEGGALLAYCQAAELAPEQPDAERKIGDLLYEKGNLKEAVLAYERAFQAAPHITSGCLARAKALMIRDRLSEARVLLLRVIADDPSNVDAHLVLAHVLIDVGRFDEARAQFERSLALAPWEAAAYKGLVRSKRLTEADRPLLEQILKRIEARDLNERERMTLHFAAGKAMDDLKDYAGAIQHFDAANRIRGKLAPKFERKECEARIERLIARYDREFFETHAGLGSVDETPVLILGMPRSGSTLIERIIASHPTVGGGGELPYWGEQGLLWAEAEMEQLGEVANSIRRYYLRVLRGIAPDALRVTDKMPSNHLWVGLVHLLFPNARIIHSRRNPVDTCLSIYSTQFAQDWPFASERANLVSYYRQYARLMDHWRAVLPSSRFLEVDYEQVTPQPETIARRLIAFLGLEWDSACLRPEQNPGAIRTSSNWQARQPIYRNSVERWRNYERWLGELGELLPTDTTPRASLFLEPK